jgi:ABC-type lipoprotein export system ATPase subunit
MQIEFNTILPNPLKDINHSEKSIWGKSFVVNKGEKTRLNATSGKGKSTFTSIVFGLRNDYTGSLFFDKKDVRSLAIDEWVEIRQRKISVVFQDLQLLPNFTVGENLILKLQLGSPFTEKDLHIFLERLGIGDKWNQKCGLLSLGQQQRVAIIRALIQPFEWLIMDEPFSHLDKENANKALQLIDEISDKNNAGFILTSLGDDLNFAFTKELNL